MPRYQPRRSGRACRDGGPGGTGLAAEAVEAAAGAFASWRHASAGARRRASAGRRHRRRARRGRSAVTSPGRRGRRPQRRSARRARAAAILRYYAGQTLEPDGETYPSHSGVTFCTRGAARGRDGDHAVEFPDRDPRLEARAGDRVRQHRRVEAGGDRAAHGYHSPARSSTRGFLDGVLNLVLGRGSVVGDTLVTHDRVDAVTFTGSNPVGRAIELKATEAGKKCSWSRRQELAVVLADADLEPRGRAGCSGRVPVGGTEVHCDQPRHRRATRAGRVRRSSRGARPVGRSATRSTRRRRWGRSPRRPSSTR